MTNQLDRVALAAENDIYVRLGGVLLEMIHPEHSNDWQEIFLHVEHVTFSDAPEAYVMATTVVLQGGERLPLAARPEIMSLAQELDQLCKDQSGKAWHAFDYRVFRDDRGPGFQCRYSYGDTAH